MDVHAAAAAAPGRMTVNAGFTSPRLDLVWYGTSRPAFPRRGRHSRWRGPMPEIPKYRPFP